MAHDVSVATGNAAQTGDRHGLGLHVRVIGRPTVVAGRTGRGEIVVRQVEFPVAPAHGLQFIAGVIVKRLAGEAWPLFRLG